MLEAKQEVSERPELTPDQMIEVAEYCVDRALSDGGANSPVVHKLMIMMIIQRFMEWHSNCSERMFEDHEVRSAICWARDAGKFQALANIIDSISVGPDDFTISQD